MARKSSFNARVRSGTPNEMGDWHEYDQPNLAKKFLRGRVETQREFTRRFNGACDEALGAISAEINSIDPRLMPVGKPRTWEASDEPSGVIFRYEIEVTSK